MARVLPFRNKDIKHKHCISEECADDDEIVVIPCKNSSGDTNLISHGSTNTPQSNK